MSAPRQPGATPAPATLSEFERLLRAWRYARAEWDMAANNPAQPEGLTEEEDSAYCDRDHSALMTFLLHPVSDARELSLKLKVACSEDACAFEQAREILEQISTDAHGLAYPSARRARA